MSSYMNLAYCALKDAGVAGTTGSLEQRVVAGLASLGTFGGASVGALSGRGRPFEQLLAAMDPAPSHGSGGTLFRRLVGGGPRQFLDAVRTAIESGGALTPLAVSDFENGVYQMSGSSAAVADLWATDEDNWGPFDPVADITAGVGLVGNPVASADLLALVAEGCTFVIDYQLAITAGAGDWAGVDFEQAVIPSYADGVGWASHIASPDVVASNSNFDFGDAPYDYHPDGNRSWGLTPPAAGTHRTAVLISPTEIARSTDGGAVGSSGPVVEGLADFGLFGFFLTHNGAATAIVKGITIYPPQPASALPGLSGS